ncbi:Fic-domain-containing protein [Coniochaeta ligniaria NRRL 30616]|uniref:Fic-domain-containing protein n=1 Tax=Coniochaeta ligniaria NRRL 30616 TaxID=1408157 RepID=A0A1J7J2T9_9PEZI|nr:Fic-domain-containing protein [Coniochaeta ligniaria NRRL 30616]
MASTIPSTTSSTGSPQINLAQALRRKMQTTVLPGGTVHPEASFTIRMADAYDYSILGDDLDPDDLHEQMIKSNTEIASILTSIPSSEQEAAADDYLLDMLSKMVFGSNYIEQAGCGLEITLKLCRQVFKGEPVPATIDETDSQFAELQSDLLRQGVSPDVQDVLRARREIVQHAKAAVFMIKEVYLSGKDLTEEIILETHRQLTIGIDTEQGYSWTQYSGVYRLLPVCAGLTSFPDADEVPGLMRRMIRNLNKDLETAVRTGTIDPVDLASKYCHQFVNIHPFLDGNGRTCRLILNALLLKYGSFLSCIGQDDETRETYLEIAANSSMNELSSQGDFDDDDVAAPKYYKQLASFILKHATEGMRGFVHALKGNLGEEA